MATSNIATDLDITNGARGTVVDIFLNPEEPSLEDASIVELKYFPQRVLFQLNRTRRTPRHSRQWCHPDFPSQVLDANCSENENDYRSQEQTIPRVIVNIASPPTHQQTLIVQSIRGAIEELRAKGVENKEACAPQKAA